MKYLLAAVALLAMTQADAGVVTVDFMANDFVAASPVTVVNGSLTYSADSLNGPLQSLLSVDLTIDGHIYALSEVGYDPAFDLFGGLVNGVDTVGAGPNDFQLKLGPNFQVQEFVYGTANDPSQIFLAGNASDTVSFAASTSVPEPSSIALSGLAILALVAAGRLPKIFVPKRYQPAGVP